jgi:hypothetical protein
MEMDEHGSLYLSDEDFATMAEFAGADRERALKVFEFVFKIVKEDE